MNYTNWSHPRCPSFHQSADMNPPIGTSTVNEPRPGIDYDPILPGDPAYPSVDDIQIDDGKPVDNIYCEKQMRLLTETLYSSWRPGRDFVAMSNVGVFQTKTDPPIVPDVLLSMDIRQSEDITNKENLSYFIWIRGKVPELAIEVVSQNAGAAAMADLLRQHGIEPASEI
jgi:hypothetical protein